MNNYWMTNKALERTAARRTFAFQMNKTVSAQAALALSGGRSAWSRYAYERSPDHNRIGLAALSSVHLAVLDPASTKYCCEV
jgi:hypothetical protein